MSLLFAVLPDQSIREQLMRERSRFAKVAHGLATHPDTLHITLFYTPSEDVDTLIAIGDKLNFPTFAFHLDMADCMAYAKVVRIGADQPPKVLFELNDYLSQAAQAAGCAPDPRAFRPHITAVNQIKTPFDPVEIAPIIWQINAIHLLRLIQSAEGAYFEAVKSWPLQLVSETQITT